MEALDGEHTNEEIIGALRHDASDGPQEADEHLAVFVEELTAHGLAGYEGEQVHNDKGCLLPCPACAGTMQFAYESPGWSVLVTWNQSTVF